MRALKRARHAAVPLCRLLQRSPAARYQTAAEREAHLRGWRGGMFGAKEAAAELKAAADKAGERMVDLELLRSRGRGRSLDELTTR